MNTVLTAHVSFRLFIAPVESDLLHRAADKSSTTAPSRSSIRRQSQPDTRERRAATRRHVSIRERLANGTLRMETTSSPREQPLPPWVATGFPPAEFGPSDLREASSIIGPDGLRQPRRDVLREMTHSGDRRRDELEAQIHELFASSDYRSNAPNRITTSRTADRNPNNSWWATNGHTRIARARLVSQQDFPGLQCLELKTCKESLALTSYARWGRGAHDTNVVKDKKSQDLPMSFRSITPRQTRCPQSHKPPQICQGQVNVKDPKFHLMRM